MAVIVIGAGRVGLANACYLAHDHDVILVDRDPNIVATLRIAENPYPGSNFDDDFEKTVKKIMVQTNIPEMDDNDTVVITTPSNSVAGILEKINPGLIIIRSTLSLDEALRISKLTDAKSKKLIGYPEFLVEGQESDGVTTYKQNFVSTVGYYENTGDLLKTFDQIYQPGRYEEFDNFTVPFFIKIWTNVGLAMKVVLANGIRDSVPAEMKININDILQGVESDYRLGTDYLRPGSGFGGSCLPFAVNQIRDIHPFAFLEDYNEHIPYTIVSRIRDNSTVLVFGYNFKKGVADYRHSNQLETIRILHNNGIKVYVTDDFYDDVVKEWWITNPLEVLDKITDIIIFYETKTLRKLESYFSASADLDSVSAWNNTNKIDFR